MPAPLGRRLAQQLGDHLHRPIHGHREADPLGPRPHRHVDADHLAVDVQQRAAGVARVDAGVGLDQVFIGLGVADLDRPVQGADDPLRDRVVIAEGVADGDHRFGGHQVAGGANGDDGEPLAGLQVDLDDGQVGIGVAGDELGGAVAAVAQGDLDLADAVDHVMVGHHVAPGVDDHAGPHAVDAAGLFGMAGLGRGRGWNGLLPADVDHRPRGARHRLDLGRLPQVRGAGGHATCRESPHDRQQETNTTMPGQRQASGSVGHGNSMGANPVLRQWSLYRIPARRNNGIAADASRVIPHTQSAAFCNTLDQPRHSRNNLPTLPGTVSSGENG